MPCGAPNASDLPVGETAGRQIALAGGASLLTRHVQLGARRNDRFWLRHVAPRHRIRLDMWREWSVVRDMHGFPKKAAQSVSPEAVAAEIERLAALPVGKLRAAWRAEFRKEPPQGLWRELLLRTLAWRLQEKAFGGHDKATLKLLEWLGRHKGDDQLHQRLKTGTVLIRDFEGVRHTVTLVPEGFVWQEKTYPSLTAIARIITGTNWNGPRFFGLREGRAKKAGQQARAA